MTTTPHPVCSNGHSTAACIILNPFDDHETILLCPVCGQINGLQHSPLIFRYPALIFDGLDDFTHVPREIDARAFDTTAYTLGRLQGTIDNRTPLLDNEPLFIEHMLDALEGRTYATLYIAIAILPAQQWRVIKTGTTAVFIRKTKTPTSYDRNGYRNAIAALTAKPRGTQ